MSAVERCLIPWPPSATAFSFIRGGASGRTDGISHGLVELKEQTRALNIKGKRMIRISVLGKTNARFLFAFSLSAREKITALQTRQYKDRCPTVLAARTTLPDFTEKICAIRSSSNQHPYQTSTQSKANNYMCTRACVCAKLTKVVVRERMRGIAQKCIVVQSLNPGFWLPFPRYSPSPYKCSCSSKPIHRPLLSSKKAKRERTSSKEKEPQLQKKGISLHPDVRCFLLTLLQFNQKKKKTPKKRGRRTLRSDPSNP